MKNLKYVLIIIIFSVCKIFPQDSTNALSFFPTHIGDIWQYYSSDYGFSEKQITKIDTSLAKDSLFIYYNNNNSATDLINVDSGIVYRHDNCDTFPPPPYCGWYPLYKLSFPRGSWWIRWVSEISPDTQWVWFYRTYEEFVFDTARNIRDYYSYDYHPVGDTITLSSSVEKLVQGIGFYKDEWEGGEIILIGAIIDGKQYGTIVNVNEQKTQQPSEFYISQNYPNPFNGQTVINYYVPKTSAVKIIVYDILGRIVAKLVDDIKSPGKYESRFNANDLSSGIYFYRITANNYSQTKKMLLLK